MATATWNTTGGDWFSAGNWNELNPVPPPPTIHYVPGPGDDVTFNGTGPYTVTYNGIDSVNSITGAGLVTLAMGGGLLTVGAGGGGLGALSTAANATFALADGTSFEIDGVAANAGTITLNALTGLTRLTLGQQQVSSPITLQGGGKITLSDSANNNIFINNSATLDNVDNTISGAGSITSNFTSLTNEARGVIDATGTLNGFRLSVPTVTNAGLLEATGVGGLQLSGDAITNAGGTILANGAGTHVDIGNYTTIAGGTLKATNGGLIEVTDGTVNELGGDSSGAPVTITTGTTLQLNDGSSLRLTSPSTTTVIVNQGTIALNSTGDRTSLNIGLQTTVSPVVLQGGGALTLSDSASNRIFIDNSATLDNVDNTISGAGSISANFTSLTNEAKGIIDAAGTNGLLLAVPTVTNKGLLEDTGTGGLQISTPNGTTVVNVGGTISATGTGTHVDLDGTTIQGGMLTTAAGGVLNVMDTVDVDGSTAGAVTVYGAVAGTGTLALTAGETTFANGARLATPTLSVAGSATADVAESLTYTGALGNNGMVELEGANTLELGGMVSGSGTVGFASGAAATLQLDAAALPNGQTFANSVTAFNPGDVIDLRGLAFQGTATPMYDATTGALSVTEGGVTDTLNLVTPGATSFVAQADGAGGTEIVVCFGAGTLIRTTRGDVPVEQLVVGDLVVTASGAHRPIRWLGHRVIDCHQHSNPAGVLPIRIDAHAFGPHRPTRNLLVSPGHAICLDVLGEVLIPAGALVNGTTIAQVEVDEVTYWHVELDSHDVILAENLPAESYLEMGNRTFFAESGIVALAATPDAKVVTHADFCRPFHADGPLVEAVKARLGKRAVEHAASPRDNGAVAA